MIDEVERVPALHRLPFIEHHSSFTGRWSSLALLMVVASMAAGCLGALPHDRATREVVQAPSTMLDLPMNGQRRHWLMRDFPRWCGAAEAVWGGNPGDRAFIVARAVRFRDETSAARALDKLTPEYLALAFRDRIVEGPRPVDYPVRLPGNEAKVSEYRVQLPPEESHFTLIGQFVAVRSGKVVIMTDSIGLPPEDLVPSLEAMVEAAASAQGGC